jgi:hypothetical protein
MSATPAANGSAGHQQVASPNGTSKLSHHSPDAHSWSDEGSSGEDAGERSQNGKRKRPVSVSCETYVLQNLSLGIHIINCHLDAKLERSNVTEAIRHVVRDTSQVTRYDIRATSLLTLYIQAGV